MHSSTPLCLGRSGVVPYSSAASFLGSEWKHGKAFRTFIKSKLNYTPKALVLAEIPHFRLISSAFPRRILSENRARIVWSAEPCRWHSYACRWCLQAAASQHNQQREMISPDAGRADHSLSAYALFPLRWCHPGASDRSNAK